MFVRIRDQFAGDERNQHRIGHRQGDCLAAATQLNTVLCIELGSCSHSVSKVHEIVAFVAGNAGGLSRTTSPAGVCGNVGTIPAQPNKGRRHTEQNNTRQPFAAA